MNDVVPVQLCPCQRGLGWQDYGDLSVCSVQGRKRLARNTAAMPTYVYALHSGHSDGGGCGPPKPQAGAPQLIDRRSSR